ncbi:MAG: metallophosphoesterase [Kurthia sp.]|nr:metallophosphoesterase [Candidatus Kurthia equi]
MATKFILFLLVALVIYGGINYYLGWNFYKALRSFGLLIRKFIYWPLFFILALTPVISRFITWDWVKVVSDYWMFFFAYGLMLAVVCNILSLILKRRYTKVISWFAIAILLVLFVVGQFNAFSPTVKELTINRTEPSQQKQLKIVFVADLHLGILSDKAHLKKFVELSNEQKPDLVVLAGDIVDDSPKWFKEQGMQAELNKLQATYGVYGILGNHEYIGDEIKEVNKVMKQSNVTMLQDETLKITEDIFLTGRDDATNDERLSLVDLKKQLEPGKPWLVLDHQPPKTLDNPDVSLMLSGHTHNGQIWPGNLLVKTMYSLAYGHESSNGTDYVVTSGFGFWGPPMRIGTKSELWSITMNFK